VRLLLFTKEHPAYLPFVERCKVHAKEILMVSSEKTSLNLYGLPSVFHHKASSIRHEELKQHAQDFNPDLMISFYYNRIIHQDLIQVPQLAVNFHGSLLPDYAGSHALNWQILRGEQKSGVTIHELTDEVDAGRIILQREFVINQEDDANDALRKGINTSLGLLDDFHLQWKQGLINPIPQVKTGNEFVCSKRTYEDGKIKKTMAPIDVVNLSRALVHPWPGLYYYNNKEEKIKINCVLSLDEAKEILRNTL